MFADDTVGYYTQYMPIHSHSNIAELQHYLDNLHDWSVRYKIKFYAFKSDAMVFLRQSNATHSKFKLHILFNHR